MPKTLLLSRADVACCMDMDDTIETVDAVFKAHGNGSVVMPAKITLDLSKMHIEAWTNAMPAYVEPFNASGVKWAGGYLNNPKVYDLSYIMAMIILQEPRTGVTLAVMEGVHITNVRTGAAAAVTAKYLARPDSSKVAIIGAGTQGRSSIEALTRIFPIKTVKVYDNHLDVAREFAEQMGAKLGSEIEAVDSCEKAAREADIIVTATVANEPLVREEWWDSGSTLISLGSYQECDDNCILRADKVLVDDWGQCSHRGELAHLVEQGLFSQGNVYAEIGKVVAGKLPGRETPKERILAVPIGLGSHDIAQAKKVFDRAVERGLGRYYEFV